MTDAAPADPIAHFSTLYQKAATTLAEPDAMVLSTVDPDGRPSGRYVLLKKVDAQGFVFFTNLGSRKARALDANRLGALTFYWPPETQVRIEGAVEPVTPAEADAYFATRPRGSQLGAAVTRPPFWSGYRLVPDRIEFWTRDPHRLHDRVLYERRDGHWVHSFLFP